MTRFFGSLSVKHPDRFFIGGQWVEPSSSRRFELISPVTEDVVGHVAAADERDVERAVDAARKAFDEGPWRRMSPAERAGHLERLVHVLHQRADELAHAWTGQIGVVYPFSQAGTGLGIEMFGFQARNASLHIWEEERPTMYPGSVGMVVREPVGVVAAIAPWNAPLFAMAIKVAPALLAGCTVVMKPSPESPLEAYILAECCEAVDFPPGVVNLVVADRDVSYFLVRQPGVDKVSFTGSTIAGKQIAGACAERIARCTLELGGKSAAILLEDIDMGEAAAILAPTLTQLTGQVCSNLTRFLVPRSREQDFVDAMVARLEEIRLGDPYDAQTAMGPVAMRRQLERVEGYIRKGLDEGASIATGGRRPASLNRGFFFEPTLFTRVDNRSTIAREEIFGPVACVTTYDGIEDAVRLANQTDFGLAGSVMTHDVDAAYRIAREVRAGTVSQNGLKPDFNIAFGGFRQSGIGREGGLEAIQPYLETKTLVLDARPATRR
ncbi:aldehyde dehydrogenase [Sphingobium sp. Sx8-8]|uniref:aldehyde dehydrogenase n=1 Tax=Sphingobium sp. Sx8-8 TaxID=2933617 RepID=UPI001F55E8FB|nr:aldehyde dehydrogenase [Sphingobium sp. Sx8-8]